MRISIPACLRGKEVSTLELSGHIIKVGLAHNPTDIHHRDTEYTESIVRKCTATKFGKRSFVILPQLNANNNDNYLCGFYIRVRSYLVEVQQSVNT